MNTDRFIPFENMSTAGLPTSLAACVHHDIPFAEVAVPVDREFNTSSFAANLKDIKTPIMDHLLATQQYDETTKFWLLAMLGRALYHYGQLDKWHLASYFTGLAGTGKSTLIDIILSIYDRQDTGIIGTQEGFALQILTPATYLIAMPEIKTDFKMAQTQFQQIATGELVTINRKHTGQLKAIIPVSMFMAGNTLALTWCDNSGSIQRRIMLFYFGYKPQSVDMSKSYLMSTFT